MLEGVEVLNHSSIKINKTKVIYIDPYKVYKAYNDADLIFITHNHYDHYSEEDIDKVKKESTYYIVPKDLQNNLINRGIKQENIVLVKPNEIYTIDGIKFSTVPAYNINKNFHPKENNWVGFIIEIEGNRYYIAGDTDLNQDNIKVKCDVAFVPVGGTYTMDYKEAAELTNQIKPKVAVPIHYGSIVGTKQDAINFINLLDKQIDGKILM